MSDVFRYAHRESSRLSPTDFNAAGWVASLSSYVDDDSHPALQQEREESNASYFVATISVQSKQKR